VHLSCPVCWGLGTCVHLRVLGSCKVDGWVSRISPVPSMCKHLLFPFSPHPTPFHAQVSNIRPTFPSWALNSCWTLKFFLISLVCKIENNNFFALGRIGMSDSRFMNFLSSSFILVKTIYYDSTWASSWIVDYFINFQKLNSIFIHM